MRSSFLVLAAIDACMECLPTIGYIVCRIILLVLVLRLASLHAPQPGVYEVTNWTFLHIG